VAQAEAAIRRCLAGPRLGFGRPPLTPQVALSRLKELAEAGTPPTPEPLAALVEALQPRRRGRPPKRGSTAAAESAAWAGLRALARSPLPVFGAGYSRCAVVAEAMRRSGFRQGATPGAVSKLARQWRRRLREMRPVLEALAQFAARAEEMRRVTDAMVYLRP
jgi:hypothetical protein